MPLGMIIAGNPLEAITSIVMDSIAGQEGLQAFEKFETFLSDLSYNLTERFNMWVTRMMFDESVLKNILGNVMNTFAINLPTFYGTPMDLGRYAKGQAVAFDGYAHKALTEVIPSLLGDIHGDTSGMLRVWGGTPADKKLFDYESGRFVSKSIAMGQKYTDMDRSFRSGFMNFTSFLDPNDTEGLSDALTALVMNDVKMPKGGVDDVKTLFDPVLDRLQSQINLAMESDDVETFEKLSGQLEDLVTGVNTLQRQSAKFSSMEEFLARMNAGMARSKSEYALLKRTASSRSFHDGI